MLLSVYIFFASIVYTGVLLVAVNRGELLREPRFGECAAGLASLAVFTFCYLYCRNVWPQLPALSGRLALLALNTLVQAINCLFLLSYFKHQ